MNDKHKRNAKFFKKILQEQQNENKIMNNLLSIKDKKGRRGTRSVAEIEKQMLFTPKTKKSIIHLEDVVDTENLDK